MIGARITAALIIICLLAGFLIGFMGASAIDKDVWHDTLVKRGLAEYYLDANHERQWRFKP